MTHRNIITQYIYPPIPIRQFDWSAVFDDYDGAPDAHCPIGRGPTEEAAIADLIEQAASDEVEEPVRSAEGAEPQP